MLSLSKNISSEIDIKIIKREVVYSPFLLIIISVFIFSFFFQFLDSPSQKITMRDFHQEVTFKQYFYLHQQFMFLCANCLPICLGGFFLCVCVCVCVKITPELMNRSFLKNLWVGPDRNKKLLKERSGSYFGYKKNHAFSEVPFQCIFNDFGFLLDISMKINLHVWFYFIVFLTILYITWETGHI